MMIQLATVAIKASVRVSPATVPPKLVMRSKSRSRSLARVSLSVVEQGLGDVGLEVGAEDQLGSRQRRGRRRRSVAGAIGGRLTISNREVGLTILALVENLGERGRNDLGGGLGAVERRGVEGQLVLAPAGETVGQRPVPSWRPRPPARGRGGDRLALAE